MTRKKPDTLGVMLSIAFQIKCRAPPFNCVFTYRQYYAEKKIAALYYEYPSCEEYQSQTTTLPPSPQTEARYYGPIRGFGLRVSSNEGGYQESAYNLNPPTFEPQGNAGRLTKDVEKTILDDCAELVVADLLQVEMTGLMDVSYYRSQEQIEFFCIALFRNVIYIYYIC